MLLIFSGNISLLIEVFFILFISFLFTILFSYFQTWSWSFRTRSTWSSWATKDSRWSRSRKISSWVVRITSTKCSCRIHWSSKSWGSVESWSGPHRRWSGRQTSWTQSWSFQYWSCKTCIDDYCLFQKKHLWWLIRISLEKARVRLSSNEK